MRRFGVYAIKNVLTEIPTAYIGSTTNSFKKRWKQHKSDLNCGRHHSQYLQRAWDKYGADAFRFVILEYVDDSTLILEREQHWLEWYRENGQVYNVSIVVDAPMKGRKHTQEAIRKIVKANLGRKHTLTTIKRMSESARKRKMSPQTEEHRNAISRALRGRRLTEEHKRLVGEANAAEYPAFVHQETGKMIPPGKNLTELCRQLDLPPQNMWKVVHGERIHCHGWRLAGDI